MREYGMLNLLSNYGEVAEKKINNWKFLPNGPQVTQI
jgi:hypothetical protein